MPPTVKKQNLSYLNGILSVYLGKIDGILPCFLAGGSIKLV